MKAKNISLLGSSEDETDYWKVNNDSVMGGLSSGIAEVKNKQIIFSGIISTENNGGFSSVFKKLPALSKAVETIKICFTGDGNRYQLRIRSFVMGYELVYKVAFLTSKRCSVTYRFYLSDFKACFRGRDLDHAPILEAANISHVGFLINSKESKRFSLTVHAIDFCN